MDKMMEHEIMRWSTMSSGALEKRLYKIRGKDKLTCFLAVAAERDTWLYKLGVRHWQSLFGQQPVPAPQGGRFLEVDSISDYNRKYRVQSPDTAAVQRAEARKVVNRRCPVCGRLIAFDSSNCPRCEAEFYKAAAKAKAKAQEVAKKGYALCPRCNRLYSENQWAECPYCARSWPKKTQKPKPAPKLNNDRYLDF